MKKDLPKKYNKLPIPRALDAAADVLPKALETCNPGCPTEKVQQRSRGQEKKQDLLNNIKKVAYRRGITCLKTDHNHRLYDGLPEEELVNITVADICQRFSSMKLWTAPGLDMIPTNKLTPFHECLAVQMTPLLMDWANPE